MALSPRKEYPDYYRLMKAYGKLNLMIKYPEIRRIFDSGNRELAAIDVLLAILGSLGKVANLIASLPTGHESTELDIQKGRICGAVIEGANSLTAMLPRPITTGSMEPPRRQWNSHNIHA
jgi:hypothetical protein